jgi:gamma-glutamylcyclotransferase (GGCT)/AIG2-like uncharacterized protein YtfP
MIIWVYGTLKKWFNNHSVMETAEWIFIKEDYIQINKLWECWFPYIELSDSSDKWLKVELYEIKDSNMYILDHLEWYTEWNTNNHYNRVLIETLSWEKVYVYEYNRGMITDCLEKHFESETPSPRFYNWKKN